MRFVISTLILLCSFSAAHADAERASIGLLIKGLSNPYWVAMQEGATQAAKAQQITLDIQGVQTDQEAEQQLNLCQTMLLKKPRALIFAAVNQTNLLPCLKQAQQQQIALIDIDGSYSQQQAKEFGLNIRFSVASNNTELGKKAAKYLTGVTGKVLILEGLAGNNPGILRVAGFKENLPKDLQIIASQPGDWDRLKAANITADILTQHPDLKVIFAANDLMALGAAETVRARKIKGITIIGIDGVQDAVIAIRKNRLSASIAQLPFLMGEQAIEKTARLLRENISYPYAQYVPVLIVNKKILSGKNDPLLSYLK